MWTYSAVDELLSQQAAHHVGAEVNDVLDLPVGLLHCLEDKHTHTESYKPHRAGVTLIVMDHRGTLYVPPMKHLMFINIKDHFSAQKSRSLYQN